jgi:asparagine synthase (glutamine-hydrolysing)
VCGICGVTGIEQSKKAESLVRGMMAAMAHRGPDGEGLLVAPASAAGAALGMRRLSIIDLAGGAQPIFNEARDVAVVCNGEIYNFRELRRTLESAGHSFRTQSDTEAIVHAWEQWGTECLAELRGMYAFALLDWRARNDAGVPQLFLARDPVGIKPLYYTWHGGSLLFASELRALLASGCVARQVSADAVTSYLLFGSVSEPVTLLEGVYSLPPGHRLLTYLPDRRRAPRPHSHWSVPHQFLPRAKDVPRDLSSAAHALRPLLEDAVRSHLVADVPVGLFLSSGLDSAAIASLAARERAGIQSFTVAFPEQEFNEAPLARRIAEHCGTRHQEVPLSGSDMLTRLEEALGALDQPSMDGINTYIASWAAQQVGLKVALSGLGGDELFGGYHTFRDTRRAARLAGMARLVPGPLRSATRPLAERLFAAFLSPDAARKAAAVWDAPRQPPHPYFFARTLFPLPDLERLMQPHLRASVIGADGITLMPTWLGWLMLCAGQATRFDSMTAVTWLELRTYTTSTLLRDTDSVSMSRSLEVRVPLLDTPLVEFVTQLPDEVKQRHSANKALLGESLGELLPPEILAQPKRTFTLPWEHWLRGPLRARIEAGLTEPSPALAPLLHADGVRAVWQNFLAGRTSWSRPWALFVLNEWCRRHLNP